MQVEVLSPGATRSSTWLSAARAPPGRAVLALVFEPLGSWWPATNLAPSGSYNPSPGARAYGPGGTLLKAAISSSDLLSQGSGCSIFP